MSQFKTILPVNVDEVLRLLPKDSFIESVTWEATAQTVEVVWSNRNLHTKLTVPTDFPLQMLHDRSTPAGAEIRPAQIIVPTVPAEESKSVIVNEKPVARGRKAGVKSGTT